MSSRCGFANARGTLDGVRRYARLAAMQLSDESVGQFIEVYKKEYGEELSMGDARTMATNLITLYRMILQPPPKKEAEPPTPRGRWVRKEKI